MDFDALAIQYGKVQMLVDMDTFPVPEPQLSEMEEMMESLVETFQEDQIERFIRIVQEEGLTAPKAAEQCDIPRISACKLLGEFNAGNGSVLPGSVPRKIRQEPKMLFPQHSAFLIGLFDVNSSTVLGEARQKLCEHFNDLEISIRGFYKHIREKCSISLK
ncbi:uncharacterized protein RHIMIDRAFT_288684 [Rhizopus microsporus ATCC 52813]|uniref:Uncharacterized protein n=1 Tax=Rhizopus microsporus ATCC 52813 TaxID=1340429 RepID=A0A2G4TA46_RHIZD|nr:uncharacterized protein RHIMIDRAFT_288684 [Rhizopus microsporus ATCC 52813]PHZ17892.1 hypothetical protein RHIMIDRAFT_288684 [Rhizopus microsporus ATCC 52813]